MGEDAGPGDVRTIFLDTPAAARAVMLAIGVAPAGIEIMAAKFTARAVHVKNLHPAAANIVKQVALSSGAEAAVHRDAVTCRAIRSDAVLFGTVKQLAAVGQKLTGQGFGLDELGRAISRAVVAWDAVLELTLAGKSRPLAPPLVMGIVNVTPDSFSDGGRYATVEAAVARAREEAAQGAAIVDVGGESTRPGSAPVGEEEELRRVIPVVEALAAEMPVSVDTRKAGVALRAAQAGAAMINDVSAGRDEPDIAEVCAEFALPYVVMHMKGTPGDMQDSPRYDDVVGDVRRFLAERAAWALSQGVEQVVVDPGIGFGKNLSHNLTLLNHVPALADLGYAVMIGHSRKRFIGELTGADVEDRAAPSVAAALAAARRGAHILRVHDVGETVAALRVYGEVEAAVG